MNVTESFNGLPNQRLKTSKPPKISKFSSKNTIHCSCLLLAVIWMKKKHATLYKMSSPRFGKNVLTFIRSSP